MIPPATGGTISPSSPALLPPGRTTWRVQMTGIPLWRQAAASRFSRSATSAPAGAAIGESATKTRCMSTMTRAVRPGSTARAPRRLTSAVRYVEVLHLYLLGGTELKR